MATIMFRLIQSKYSFNIALFALCLIISLLGVAIAKHFIYPKLAFKCSSFSNCENSIIEKKQLIKSKLSSTSPDLVYEEIKQAYASKKTTEQHEIAHLFGQILYQQNDIDTIGVCDSKFGFGCYHGFFIEAITDKGISIVPELDQSCIRKFGRMGLGCQHGIGHGLMEYFGPKKLVQALLVCEQLDWKKPLLGCAGGVFMEYYLPLNEQNTSSLSTAIPFDPLSPYGACYRVPERFRQECFYNLGMWWNQVLNKDYQKMLDFCSLVKEPLLREHCLLGLGNAAATTSSLNTQKIKNYCDQTPLPYAQTICRAGAAWVFFTTPSVKDQSSLLCEDLPSNQRALCNKKTNIIGNL